MDSIRYVIRFFLDNQYMYSVHCGHDILEEVIKEAKDSGYSIKVVAYTENFECEV